MRFLIESEITLLDEIKQSLIQAGIDLTSKNGGKCKEASEHIRDIFGYDAYTCSIFPHNEFSPISSNGHCVNLIDGKVVDFTASQYSAYVNDAEIPCPVVATFNEEKNAYESKLFDYYLSSRR